MKTYSKTHKSKKAATSHTRKIKKRGGKIKKTEVSFGQKLSYSFRK